MKTELARKCSSHHSFECPDNLFYQHKDGKIGIIIHDGGMSIQVIDYCPFCGTKL